MVTNLKFVGLVLFCSTACFAIVGIDAYPKIVYDLYVDASLDNLGPTDEVNYPNVNDWLSSTTTTNFWYHKVDSISAINGSAFQGFGTTLPQLAMNVTGLDSARTYDVYAVCWVKKATGTEYWYTYAAIGGNQFQVCDYNTADIIFNEGQFVIQGAQVYIGQVSGVQSFTVDVDGPETTSVSRAWFDGIALVENPIKSVTPAPGQNDYNTDEIVQLNAADYVDCPQIYKFERWIGDVTEPYQPQTTVKMSSYKTVTAVFNYSDNAVCGDLCHPIILGDLNSDCMVDLKDFAILANDWCLN